MLSGWFNTKELDEFADSLVAELVERFPPAGGVAGAAQLGGKERLGCF